MNAPGRFPPPLVLALSCVDRVRMKREQRKLSCRDRRGVNRWATIVGSSGQ